MATIEDHIRRRVVGINGEPVTLQFMHLRPSELTFDNRYQRPVQRNFVNKKVQRGIFSLLGNRVLTVSHRVENGVHRYYCLDGRQRREIFSVVMVPLDSEFTLQCNVYSNLTFAQEISIFLMINCGSCYVKFFDKFTLLAETAQTTTDSIARWCVMIRDVITAEGFGVCGYTSTRTGRMTEEREAEEELTYRIYELTNAEDTYRGTIDANHFDNAHNMIRYSKSLVNKIRRADGRDHGDTESRIDYENGVIAEAEEYVRRTVQIISDAFPRNDNGRTMSKIFMAIMSFLGMNRNYPGGLDVLQENLVNVIRQWADHYIAIHGEETTHSRRGRQTSIVNPSDAFSAAYNDLARYYARGTGGGYPATFGSMFLAIIYNQHFLHDEHEDYVNYDENGVNATLRYRNIVLRNEDAEYL